MTYRMNDIEDYRNVDLICRASYSDNPNTRPFSLHPIYMVKNGDYTLVEEDAKEVFRENGAFTAMPTGRLADYYASEIREHFGGVVVARVREFKSNNSFDGFSVVDELLARVDPSNPRSDALVQPLAESDVAKGLYQVLMVPDKVRIDFSKPLKQAVRLSAESGVLYSSHIFLQQAGPNGPEFYGPFAYQLNQQQGLLSLFASDALDYRVYRLHGVPSSERIALDKGTDGGYAPLAMFLRRSYVDARVQSIDVEEAYDWLSGERMSELFRSIINGSEKMKSFDSSLLKALKSAILDYSTSSSGLNLDAARRKRLEDAVSDMEESIVFNKEVLSQIFGRVDDERLGRIVSNEEVYPAIKDRLLQSASVKEKIDEERRSLEREIDDVRLRCDALRKEAREAEVACQLAREEEAEAKANAKKTIEDILSSKQDEVATLDEQIKERQVSIRAAQERYERAIYNKKAVEDQIDGILANLNNEATTTGKILESEILRKVVRAINELNLKESEPTVGAPAFIPVREGEDDMTPLELVREISDRVTKKAGRDLTDAEVINMATCLMQGYITTFSGLPGTGKTSMCRILAGALGLVNDDPDRARFTEIDVENGWTSYKDYIGYHNPIAKTYERSIPQVFDAMKRLSGERAGDAQAAPYLFLLDEANLSPIEHYWGPFMHACDTFRTCGGRIALGSEEDWKLPGHVRFMATVNYDHTTEALSPRFLDRSWVITLDALESQAEVSSADPLELFAHGVPYSYNKLMSVFGTESTTLEDAQVSSLFMTLTRICKSSGAPISYRSLQMMRRYIAAASPLMKAAEVNDPYAALDFAFSQKVLPTIVGSREMVRPLVDGLLKECQSLRVTTNLLEEMKKHGEDSGYYQYFI